MTSGKEDELCYYSRLLTRVLYWAGGCFGCGFFFLNIFPEIKLLICYDPLSKLAEGTTEHSHLFSLFSSLAGQQTFRKACLKVTPVS